MLKGLYDLDCVTWSPQGKREEARLCAGSDRVSVHGAPPLDRCRQA